MAYGVQPVANNPVGVAPKVQSTNMAPRQQAIKRRANKPPAGKTAVITGSKSGQVVGPNLAPAKNPLNVQNNDIDKYLAGDEGYQSILASLDKNKATAKSTYDYNVNQYKMDNAEVAKRMADQELKDNSLLDNDYAARGMFGSGLFNKADTDLGQGYNQQNEDRELSFARNLQQLLTDSQSQNALDEETRRQAELDAITRRAQEFGIFGGPSNLTEIPKKTNGGGKDKKKGKGKK